MFTDADIHAEIEQTFGRYTRATATGSAIDKIRQRTGAHAKPEPIKPPLKPAQKAS